MHIIHHLTLQNFEVIRKIVNEKYDDNKGKAYANFILVLFINMAHMMHKIGVVLKIKVCQIDA